MTSGTHQYQQDSRHNNILNNINGDLFHRSEAKISVFDSGFILGDGVWEGIRLHNGRLAFIKQHMRRLYDGAEALDMDIGLTRGVKSTPYQDPRVTTSAATIVIIAEHKSATEPLDNQGVSLFTSHVEEDTMMYKIQSLTLTQN
jgi:branched-chain amino acid aminotransferase